MAGGRSRGVWTTVGISVAGALRPSLPTLCVYALTPTGVGIVALLCIIAAATAARRLVESRRVRRGVEAGTGLVFVGLATLLAADS